jgi:hypothetical protein
MTAFFKVSHNSFETRGFPWGQEILSGLVLVKVCFACAQEGRRIERPHGEVEIRLEKRKGSRWPDVLGCGAWPLFIVSRRVLADWQHSGVRDIPAYPVRIADPVPKKLQNAPMPEYFWLDGENMPGATLDLEASGFVNVSFCPKCGTRIEDISATYKRQHTGTWPMAIIESTWNGADVFTTDLSPAAFFCTEKVLECAKRNKHTNFRFVPAAVAASPAKGIKYL